MVFVNVLLQEGTLGRRLRPLVFLLAVAMVHGQVRGLMSRTRALNAYGQPEIFTDQIIRDNNQGLSRLDIRDFITWLIESPVEDVNSREKLVEKLSLLKLQRFAYFHIFCADGRVAPANSMLPFHAETA